MENLEAVTSHLTYKSLHKLSQIITVGMQKWKHKGYIMTLIGSALSKHWVAKGAFSPHHSLFIFSFGFLQFVIKRPFISSRVMSNNRKIGNGSICQVITFSHELLLGRLNWNSIFNFAQLCFHTVLTLMVFLWLMLSMSGSSFSIQDLTSTCQPRSRGSMYTIPHLKHQTGKIWIIFHGKYEN